MFKVMNQLQMLAGPWRKAGGRPEGDAAAVGCTCRHRGTWVGREVSACPCSKWHRELSGERQSLEGAARFFITR